MSLRFALSPCIRAPRDTDGFDSHPPPSSTTMRAFTAATILGSSIAAVACGPAEPEYTLAVTPSGHSFKLESISETVRPSGEAALLLIYQTDLELTDGRALEAEIDSIWEFLRPEVEKRGLKMAIVRAIRWEKPSWERRGNAAEYLIEQSPAGQWAGRPDDTTTTAPPGTWQPLP